MSRLRELSRATGQYCLHVLHVVDFGLGKYGALAALAAIPVASVVFGAFVGHGEHRKTVMVKGKPVVEVLESTHFVWGLVTHFVWGLVFGLVLLCLLLFAAGVRGQMHAAGRGKSPAGNPFVDAVRLMVQGSEEALTGRTVTLSHKSKDGDETSLSLGPPEGPAAEGVQIPPSPAAQPPAAPAPTAAPSELPPRDPS